jgi:nucleoside-diphosphate-sugar epimerase
MDLVVGDTSQLVYYFDNSNTNFCSSRNYVGLDRGYNNVILTFAEQRTHLNLSLEDFVEVNVNYTLEIVKKISDRNEKVILFGSSELWNNYNGPINIDVPFDFQYSHYIHSKELLIKKIKKEQQKNKLMNVFFIHPFNFNSPYRKKGFLFAKIFDSIINKKQIEVGNINIFRDIIHPKLIINEIKNIENDVIVGSGVLTNIKEFTNELFMNFGLDYKELVIENTTTYSPHADKCFWYGTEKLYTNLLKDTILDIEKKINK